jgi:hypothetical protein
MSNPFALAWLLLGLLGLGLGKKYLVFLSVISSCFQLAAVFNLSLGSRSIPLIPYYYVSVIIGIRLTAEIVMSRGRVKLPSALYIPTTLLIAFTFFVIPFSIVLPVLYEGTLVFEPRAGIKDFQTSLQPLTLTASQIGQTGYLILNVIVFVFVQAAALRSDLMSTMERALHTVAAIVVFFTVWQLLHRTLGIFYPTELLYSAEARAASYTQSLAGIPRLNGPLSEPSNLAAFMSGYFAFVLQLWAKLRKPGHLILLALTALSLLASTSTTAILILTVVAGLTIMMPFLSKPLLSGFLSRSAFIQAVGVFATVALVTVFFISTEIGQSIFTAAIGNKAESVSYDYRAGSNVYALRLLSESPLFGFGLGSNRPSSFLAYLLSNVGLVGSALFFAFLLALSRSALRTAAKSKCNYYDTLARATLWGLWVHIAAKAISQPDLSFAVLWVWICAVGVVVASASTVRSPRVTRVPEPVHRHQVAS